MWLSVLAGGLCFVCLCVCVWWFGDGGMYRSRGRERIPDRYPIYIF